MIQYTLFLRKLGLNLEPKEYNSEDAKYYSSFCSARFYPVKRISDKSLTCVLATGIGRFFAKTGFYINLPEKLKALEVLKGDMLSRYQDCHSIPFISHYIIHILKLVADEQAKMPEYMLKEHRAKSHVVDKYEYSDETWDMLNEVYHLDRSHLEQFESELKNVVSLPYVLDLPMFHYAMVVDGMITGNKEGFPDVEEKGLVNIPPPDMTEVPKDTFIEECQKHCPLMLHKPIKHIQNDIDLDTLY